MASEEKNSERRTSAQLKAEAREAGDSASAHAKESAAEYKQQMHKAGLSALKGAEEQYQSAEGATVEQKDRLVDYATDTKNSAADTVHVYTEAAKKKLGDLGEATQQTYEQSKQTAAETAENVKQRTQETYNQTVEHAVDTAQNAKDQTANAFNETSESARQTAQEAKSDSQNMYGAVKDNTYDYIEEAKINLFHEGGKDSSHEAGVDSANTKTADDNAVENLGGKGTAAGGRTLGAAISDTTGTVWDTSKEKVSEGVEAVDRRADDAKDGTKRKVSEWTTTHGEGDGGAGESGKTDGLDEGVKHKASQVLGSVQNETADTFGDTQDRKTLSESTAGYTDRSKQGARDVAADSTWDATVDKTKFREYREENPGGGILSSSNWSNIKEKASQFLGSTQNETADTLNDSADRASLSESTAGAKTKSKEVEEAPSPWDTTRDKTMKMTTAEDHHEQPGGPGSGGVGVNWAGLKLKASQILESFSNETADTFDTVQDRKSISESTAGTAAEEHGGGGTAAAAAEATMPFDHTNDKTSVHDKVREVAGQASAAADQEMQFADSLPQSASGNHEQGAPTGAGAGGFTWESLKQKASDVLGGIQLSTPRSTGDDDQETQREHTTRVSSLDNNMNKKFADIAAMKQRAAQDAASKSVHEETDFTSETRRATADQVADYANH